MCGDGCGLSGECGKGVCGDGCGLSGEGVGRECVVMGVDYQVSVGRECVW